MSMPRHLGRTPPLRLLLAYALPSMVGLVGQALYVLVDRAIIGRVTGPDGLAALTLAYPVLVILIGCAYLPSGAATLLSIRLGEARPDEAARCLATGITAALGLSVLVTVSGLLLRPVLVPLSGATGILLEYASAYLGILMAGFVFQALAVLVVDAHRAAGHPHLAMLLAVAGVLLNILLDFFLVVGLRLGVSGAALGTIIAQATVSATGLILLRRHTDPAGWTRAAFRPDPARLAAVFAIGSAPFFMQWASSAAHLLLNRQLMAYGGGLAVSALGVVHSIALLLINPVVALGLGMQPIVGYNLGAGARDRVRRVLLLAFGLATLILLAGYLVCQAFPTAVFGLFTYREDLLALGPRALRLMFLALPLVGFQIIAMQYYHAAGQPLRAIVLSLSRLLILLPALYFLLPVWFGLDGLWMASPLSDTLMALVTAGFVLHTFRRGFIPGRATRYPIAEIDDSYTAPV